MRNYEKVGDHWYAYDATGFAFRCRRLDDGSWYATPSHIAHATDARSFGSDTLKGVASKVGGSSHGA